MSNFSNQNKIAGLYYLSMQHQINLAQITGLLLFFKHAGKWRSSFKICNKLFTSPALKLLMLTVLSKSGLECLFWEHLPSGRVTFRLYSCTCPETFLLNNNSPPPNRVKPNKSSSKSKKMRRSGSISSMCWMLRWGLLHL